MQEKITPHLREQARTNRAIELQFYQDPEEAVATFPLMDPLSEDEHEAVKGVVHKYFNRALVKKLPTGVQRIVVFVPDTDKLGHPGY